MSCKRAIVPAKHLFNGFRPYQDVPLRAATLQGRTMTTQATTEIPSTSSPAAPISMNTSSSGLTSAISHISSPTAVSPATTSPLVHQPVANPFITNAPCTLYAFPSLEPTATRIYPASHLLLPVRKDILHRAVIYEGDKTRQGSANTKWRDEVHGSGRKIRPQKGSGSARLGDKKSPMLRGGGRAFGPKPRDFSTELPRKVYDMAWRTALSYRYKKGDLLVTDSAMGLDEISEGSVPRYLKEFLDWNQMGGRTLFLTAKRRESLFAATETGNMKEKAWALTMDDVDVKDLLTGARVIVERAALEWIFTQHEHDLAPDMRLGALDERSPSFLISQ